jgi:cell shape-determining protein MreD
MWFLIILIFILTLLQGSVTTLPLVILFFLNAAVVTKKTWIFPVAFLTGLVLDILLLNPMGKTSLFLVIFLFVILLYDKKFDIQTFPFVFLASFIGSLIYFIVVSHTQNIFTQAIISAVISTLSFFLLVVLNKFDIKEKVGFNEG